MPRRAIRTPHCSSEPHIQSARSLLRAVESSGSARAGGGAGAQTGYGRSPVCTCGVTSAPSRPRSCRALAIWCVNSATPPVAGFVSEENKYKSGTAGITGDGTGTGHRSATRRVRHRRTSGHRPAERRRGPAERREGSSCPERGRWPPGCRRALPSGGG